MKPVAEIPLVVRVNRKTNETEIFWRDGTEEELRRMVLMLLHIGESALTCLKTEKTNDQRLEEPTWQTDG